MRALIVGSMPPDWSEGTKDFFKRACRELGRELAKSSIDLVVGSDGEETSDRYVVEGAASAEVNIDVVVCKPEPDGPDAESWRNWRPFSDKEAEFTQLEFQHKPSKGNWSSIRLHQILAADVVVIIGGNLDPDSGVTQTAYSAPVLGRPVFIVPAFRASDTWLYARFEGDYDRLGLSSEMNLFQGNWTGDRAETAVDLVQRLLAKNPYKRGDKWGGISILIAVLFLLAMWVTVFIFPFQQKIVSFFLLLSVSVVLGTVLRNTNFLGNVETPVDQQRLPVRLAAGLILAFCLALMYFAGGSLIDGNFKFMSFPNPDDFARVSVTMSFLGLGAAILLEQAAARLVAYLRSVVTDVSAVPPTARKKRP